MEKYKIILAPAALKDAVVQCELGDRPVALGLSVMTPQTLRRSLSDALEHPARETAGLFLRVRGAVSPDNLYRSQLRFPAFFREFLAFARDLIRENVPAADLPEDTPAEKSQKEILAWIMDQDLYCRHLPQRLADAEPRDAWYVAAPVFTPDLTEARQLRQLLDSGKARPYPLPVPDRHEYEFYSAANRHQEVLAAAAYLLDHDLDPSRVFLLTSDPEGYQPIIRQVFAALNLPVKLSYSTSSPLACRFRAGLAYLQQPDLDRFWKAYGSGCFGEPDGGLKEYADAFHLTLDQLKHQDLDYAARWHGLTADEPASPLCDRRDYHYLTAVERRLRDTFAPVREVLDQADALRDIRQRTAFLYDLVSRSPEAATPRGQNALQQIYDLCQDIVPLAGDSPEAYALLDDFLGNIRWTESVRQTGGVTVSDAYRDVLDPEATVLVLGCTQQDFPKTVNRTGLFDEAYLQKVPSYPRLSERAAHFTAELTAAYRRMRHVVFFYPSNTLDGSSNDPSSFIFSFVEKQRPAAPKPVRPVPAGQTGGRLSPDTARQLYLRQGTLTASPSALETFVGCPFAYWLQYGLRLDRRQLFAVGANTLGTLQHDLLKRMMSGELTITDEAQLNDALTPYFDQLEALLPNDRDMLEAMKRRLTVNLSAKLPILNDTLAADDWKPSGFEQSHRLQLALDGFTLDLKGTIDRLDLWDDRFLVVDYKSSGHTISADSVVRGRTLQLLCYLLLVSRQHPEWRPTAAAYFNLKNEPLDGDDYGPQGTGRWRQANLYKAYLCDPDGELDKRLFSTARFKPRWDRWEKTLCDILQAVGAKIVSGVNAVDPRNDACTFCPYRTVCHSRYDASVPSDPLTELPKEEEDDE